MLGGIAEITDTGPEILVATDCKSTASITAAGGTVEGGATIGASGMITGATGYLEFAAIVGNASLETKGQIVAKFTTQRVVQRDDAGTVSGSNGLALAPGVFLWATLAQARALVSNTNQFQYRINSTDGNSPTGKITSLSKLATVEVCIWWDNTTDSAGLFEHGMDLFPMSIPTDSPVGSWATIRFGTNAAANNNFFGSDGTSAISDIVVSTQIPFDLIDAATISLGAFGDSYVDQGTFPVGGTPATPRLDGVFEKEITAFYARTGVHADITMSGFSNFTVCDTGANDLSNEIAAFAALERKNVSIIAGNNDVTIVDAGNAFIDQALDATTGTETRLTEYIEAMLANGTEKIALFTTGSLKTSAFDTTEFQDHQVIIDAIIRNVADLFPQVELVEIADYLGDTVAENPNYQGYWDTIGNLGSGGSAGPVAAPGANRHPSGQGGHGMALGAFTVFTKVSTTSLALTFPLTFDLTG